MDRDSRALELDKILERLAAETSSEDAAALARETEPETELSQVERRLRETDDAFVLSAKYGSPSFYGMTNVTNALRRAQAGGVLSLAELLRISGTLHAFRAIRDWYGRGGGGTSLTDLFEAVSPNRFLEERIDTTVMSEEEVADTASTALAAIRRRIRQAGLRIRERLDQMIHSQTYSKYLQEAIVTQRGGRYVVPVKAEYRSEVKGLIHDSSGSGATVFIEPAAVVEANNEIRVLHSEELEEIERILRELSREIGSFADGLCASWDAAVRLDLIFAKASLAYKMKAVVPKLNREGRLLLRGARHPLIDPKAVVPTDISLGSSFDALIVTGPNTGGKTVALKTCGLLALMARCGLMIPAEEGSEIAVFRRVLADIGDEQSIEQSLSTFSAHMTNIIRILAEADTESLVLIDELGAGTDPVEGSALAVSIIETMRRKGVRLVATTHYAELKAYALNTPGVENGSCEFDVETLRPTYRLLIGVPGRSNAFAISRRLGMPEAVVERAQALVSEEDTAFEDVVGRLEESRRALESERGSAQREREAAERARAEAEALRAEAENAAKRALDEARRDASRLVQQTRRQADALLDELEAARKKKERGLSAEDRAKLRSGLRDLEKTSDPVRERTPDAPYVLPRPLVPGDEVTIYELDKPATVLEVAGEQALVQAGIVKTRVPVASLRLREKTAPPKAPRGARGVTKDTSSAPARLEIDVRGMNVEEAVLEVDAFLDRAVLQKLETVTVIHGKGTGALRSGIQQHLRHHRAVKSFRLGVYGEGESGVTVVELK